MICLRKTDTPLSCSGSSVHLTPLEAFLSEDELSGDFVHWSAPARPKQSSSAKVQTKMDRFLTVSKRLPLGTHPKQNFSDKSEEERLVLKLQKKNTKATTEPVFLKKKKPRRGRGARRAICKLGQETEPKTGDKRKLGSNAGSADSVAAEFGSAKKPPVKKFKKYVVVTTPSPDKLEVAMESKLCLCSSSSSSPEPPPPLLPVEPLVAMEEQMGKGMMMRRFLDDLDKESESESESELSLQTPMDLMSLDD